MEDKMCQCECYKKGIVKRFVVPKSKLRELIDELGLSCAETLQCICKDEILTRLYPPDP